MRTAPDNETLAGHGATLSLPDLIAFVLEQADGTYHGPRTREALLEELRRVDRLGGDVPTALQAPEGWVLMPDEPTDEIIQAGVDVLSLYDPKKGELFQWVLDAYRQMLWVAAHPDPGRLVPHHGSGPDNPAHSATPPGEEAKR